MTVRAESIPPWAQGEITATDIKKLSRREDDLFIVFINNDNEVDWVTSPVMNTKMQSDAVLEELINSTQGKIQLSYNKIPDYINKTSRIYALLVDILAEAAVCALYNKRDLADSNIRNFEERVESYLNQYVRGLILDVCACALLITILLLIILKIHEASSFLEIFANYSMFGYSFCIGIFGAVFSIFMKKTQIGIDFFDKNFILREIIAKIVAGGMAGCILYFFINGKFIPFTFKEGVNYLCFAFLAGFSERFIPDILAKKKEE